MAMRISKGVSLVCVVAIFISLLFVKVADAASSHFGIHAVGHAVEPYCPGGYSDRGDHCGHVGHVSTRDGDEEVDFVDDHFNFAGDKASIHVSLSESTEAAEKQAEDLEFDNISPESITRKVVVLGH